MDNKIKKTEEFLKCIFDESPYFKLHEDEKNYRIEHSYRVANIGKEIAIKEGFNVEALVIGCLLHDISYSIEFKNEDDWVNHGRKSAIIARDFLEELGLESDIIDEICFGIAIHVDDEADFQGERTPFALSIGEADNIDRFDAYRIYENLQNLGFDKMTLKEKQEKVVSMLERLNKFKCEEFITRTSTELWNSKIDFQIDFFNKLKKQLENSGYIN